MHTHSSVFCSCSSPFICLRRVECERRSWSTGPIVLLESGDKMYNLISRIAYCTLDSHWKKRNKLQLIKYAGKLMLLKCSLIHSVEWKVEPVWIAVELLSIPSEMEKIKFWLCWLQLIRPRPSALKVERDTTVRHDVAAKVHSSAKRVNSYSQFDV